MDRGVDGKVVIVTGAGQGMGRATALLLGEAGARVLAADADAASAEETAELIHEGGGEAASVRVDVSRSDEVAAMVAAAAERYGRLDRAVNNAAFGPDRHPIAEMVEEEFDRVIAVNLKGVALCLRHELAQLRAQGASSRC